eukprot:NODE_10511_length_510_cov_6.627907_g9863_i0.p1 GENE.NODE_10511_length_510_cov_6.627907_g9863_i0~~NODE_10511_length_510_cov_6.627907_g9863_i0.p1  ORF type:complete len:101 (-),score=28.84 NODE_10511_length_510_cov_6.627907_g9863_i0:175-477(-)
MGMAYNGGYNGGYNGAYQSGSNSHSGTVTRQPQPQQQMSMGGQMSIPSNIQLPQAHMMPGPNAVNMNPSASVAAAFSPQSHTMPNQTKKKGGFFSFGKKK